MQLFDKYKVESFCFKYIDKYVSKIENEKLLKIQKFMIIFKFDSSSTFIQYLNKKIDEKISITMDVFDCLFEILNAHVCMNVCIH